jgi:import inner membrane translocase subunit TIM13
MLVNHTKHSSRLRFHSWTLQTVRDKCFKVCITAPGTSLSSSDQKCLGRCMDRYQDVSLEMLAEFDVVACTCVYVCVCTRM